MYVGTEDQTFEFSKLQGTYAENLRYLLTCILSITPGSKLFCERLLARAHLSGADRDSMTMHDSSRRTIEEDR